MSSRRALVIAGVVVVLCAAVATLALTVWGGPRDKPSPAKPTGPAADAADVARAALADSLETTVDQITVVSVVEHTWNDASLGLPEPGMMYAQVVTNGHIVTLTCQGKTYVYHVAGQAAVPNPGAE